MSPAPRRAAIDRGIDDLVRRYGLSADAATRLGSLLELLVDDPLAPTAIRGRRAALDDPLAPTAIRGRRAALDDHLADSLVALELPQVRAATAVADLGAGAGLPGLPLAIALPDSDCVLVESSQRKCQFLERAISVCALNNARVVHARVESWPEGLGRFDLVTARALAPLDVVAEYAAPLLRTGGTLVAWRGRRDEPAEAAAAMAARRLGLEPSEPLRVRPYPGAENRHLHLMSKVMETPQGFPRRPGVARKRPLGESAPPSDRPRR